MPKLLGVDADQAAQTMHGFDYTSIAVSKLGASEYTFAGIALDITSSVSPFKSGLEKMLEIALGSLKKSPRVLNLLARTTAFNSFIGIEEFHGFTLLNSIDPAGFNDLIQPNGMTNLRDATLDIVESIDDCAMKLFDDEVIMNANGIIYIITDGDDNQSRKSVDDVKDAIASIRRNEALESIQIVLVGVNDDDPHFKKKLEKFQDAVGIDKYLSMGDASEDNLAKLGGLISQSVSSTSTNLGTGQPSQDVNNFKF